MRFFVPRPAFRQSYIEGPRGGRARRDGSPASRASCGRYFPRAPYLHLRRPQQSERERRTRFPLGACIPCAKNADRKANCTFGRHTAASHTSREETTQCLYRLRATEREGREMKHSKAFDLRGRPRRQSYSIIRQTWACTTRRGSGQTTLAGSTLCMALRAPVRVGIAVNPAASESLRRRAWTGRTLEGAIEHQAAKGST